MPPGSPLRRGPSCSPPWTAWPPRNCRGRCRRATPVPTAPRAPGAPTRAGAPRCQVLLISGFLGAGKTTLLSRILANREGLRVAVLVNDMADVNVDAELIAGGRGAAALSATRERLVALSNGCICCTLREDLVEEVTRLALRGGFDWLLIEGTGIAEPAPVAATLAATGERGASLMDYARLDSVVTVVDAARLDTDFSSAELLAQRGLAAHDADGRSVAALIADQIEFADTLILNKCDVAGPEGAARAEAMLRALNPAARCFRAVRCDVPVAELLEGGRRFSLTRAAQARTRAAASARAPALGRGGDMCRGARWQAAQWGEELSRAAGGAAARAPESEEYGISSVTFRARRPFHPRRLWDAVMQRGLCASLLRSKGVFWLASRCGVAWQWSSAGRTRQFGPQAQWRADAVPRELWPSAAEEPGWDAEWGDRRTQLVLIGQGGAPAAAAAALQACVLGDAEMAAGEAAWEAWENPWAALEMSEEEAAAAAAAMAGGGAEVDARKRRRRSDGEEDDDGGEAPRAPPHHAPP